MSRGKKVKSSTPSIPMASPVNFTVRRLRSFVLAAGCAGIELRAQFPEAKVKTVDNRFVCEKAPKLTFKV